MLSLHHTHHTTHTALTNTLLDAVEFYGFVPIENILKTHTKGRTPVMRATPALYTPHEKKLATLTKQLIQSELNKAHAPRSFYTFDTRNEKKSTIHLHISGTPTPVAESMLFTTLRACARKNNLSHTTLYLNSMGDKESHLRYVRELHQFLRNHVNDLPSPFRGDIQSGHPIRAFLKLHERGHECVARAPQPIEYLNDESRRRLHDTLEYIEHIGIPYEFDPTIVGSGDCWNHALFQVRARDANGNEIILAHGGRHDSLAYKTYRANLPLASVILEFESRLKTPPRRKKNPEKPLFFFAQLGTRAKMKSFTVLDVLHEAGIPVAHLIPVESIGGQLSYAERHGIPYTIIMGHKESLDNTVVIRNMETRSQTTVPIAQLPTHLRNIQT